MMSKRPRIKRVPTSSQLLIMTINEGYAKHAEKQLLELKEFSNVMVQRRNVGTVTDPFHMFAVFATPPSGMTVPKLVFNRSKILSVNNTTTLLDWLRTV